MSWDRAVSSNIGVILMVALTVIVFSIGAVSLLNTFDQEPQDTSQTTVDFEQRTGSVHVSPTSMSNPILVEFGSETVRLTQEHMTSGYTINMTENNLEEGDVINVYNEQRDKLLQSYTIQVEGKPVEIRLHNTGSTYDLSRNVNTQFGNTHEIHKKTKTCTEEYWWGGCSNYYTVKDNKYYDYRDLEVSMQVSPPVNVRQIGPEDGNVINNIDSYNNPEIYVIPREKVSRTDLSSLDWNVYWKGDFSHYYYMSSYYKEGPSTRRWKVYDVSRDRTIKVGARLFGCARSTNLNQPEDMFEWVGSRNYNYVRIYVSDGRSYTIDKFYADQNCESTYTGIVNGEPLSGSAVFDVDRGDDLYLEFEGYADYEEYDWFTDFMSAGIRNYEEEDKDRYGIVDNVYEPAIAVNEYNEDYFSIKYSDTKQKSLSLSKNRGHVANAILNPQSDMLAHHFSYSPYIGIESISSTSNGIDVKYRKTFKFSPNKYWIGSGGRWAGRTTSIRGSYEDLWYRWCKGDRTETYSISGWSYPHSDSWTLDSPYPINNMCGDSQYGFKADLDYWYSDYYTAELERIRSSSTWGWDDEQRWHYPVYSGRWWIELNEFDGDSFTIDTNLNNWAALIKTDKKIKGMFIEYNPNSTVEIIRKDLNPNDNIILARDKFYNDSSVMVGANTSGIDTKLTFDYSVLESSKNVTIKAGSNEIEKVDRIGPGETRTINAKLTEDEIENLRVEQQGYNIEMEIIEQGS